MFIWFANNKMKANHDKCNILLSTKESLNIQIANFAIKSSKAKRFLGITLDKNIKFDIHVESICLKANIKTQCPCKNNKLYGHFLSLNLTIVLLFLLFIILP